MDHKEKVRVDLWASVEGVSDEVLNTKVDEGVWSIAQVLEHLYLIETQVAKFITEAIKSAEKKEVTPKKIHLAVHRTHKFQAPDFAIPSDEYITLDALKAQLHTSRVALNQSVEGVSDEELNQKAIPHPAFGELSLKQWVQFIGYHEERHINQIQEIKETLNR